MPVMEPRGGWRARVWAGRNHPLRGGQAGDPAVCEGCLEKEDPRPCRRCVNRKCQINFTEQAAVHNGSLPVGTTAFSVHQDSSLLRDHRCPSPAPDISGGRGEGVFQDSG